MWRGSFWGVVVFPGPPPPPPPPGLDPPGRAPGRAPGPGPGLVSGLVVVPVRVLFPVFPAGLLGPVWGRFSGKGEAAACVEGREVRRGSDMVVE